MEWGQIVYKNCVFSSLSVFFQLFSILYGNFSRTPSLEFSIAFEASFLTKMELRCRYSSPVPSEYWKLNFWRSVDFLGNLPRKVKVEL